MNQEIELRKIPIADLNFADYNPRKISEEQFTRLRESIKAFGMTQPIIVNDYPGRENVIVGGHQRARAAGMEGYTELLCSIVNLPEKEEKLLNIALNRISGEWDRDKVGKILVSLNDDDAAIRLTGFEDDEVGILIDEQTGILGPEEKDAGDIPDKKDEEPADSHTGELYELGIHRLYCGDPSDSLAWSELLGDERPDLIFSNIPEYDPDHDREDYNRGIGEWLANIGAFTQDRAPVYLIATAKEYPFMVDRMNCHLPSFNIKSSIVWLRRRANTVPTDYTNRHDVIIYAGRKGERQYFNGGTEGSDVWGIIDELVHVGQTPHWLVVKSLLASSKKGQLIVDPNAGKGDTLFAGNKLKRRVFLIEKDPHKCDTIRKEWAKVSP